MGHMQVYRTENELPRTSSHLCLRFFLWACSSHISGWQSDGCL